MRRARSAANVLTLGGRVPPAVGGLLAALVLVSIAGAIAPGVRAGAALVPRAVGAGEVWRLLTWSLLETSPVSLLFEVLTLYWFGRDLCWAWGPRRFLAMWAGFAAASGAIATFFALALALPAGWAGPWPVLLAFVVAWGLLYPERQILLMLALPVTGRSLVWLTVLGTLLFAVFYGFADFLPEFAAEGLVLLWFRGVSPRGAWQSFRIWLGERRLRRKARHLRVVKKNGTGGPPRYLN